MTAQKDPDFYTRVSNREIPGVHQDNKFGIAPSGVQTTRTSIWDRADATPTQQVWVPPTQARQHNIASTSLNDTAGGTGARKIQIWGLESWDQTSYDSTEIVVLDGTNNVLTSKSYVIIYRMRVTKVGNSATLNNIGTITATAVTDGTVTAAIRPGNGATDMAIFAIPKGWRALVHSWHIEVDKASGAAATVSFAFEDIEYSDPSNPVMNVRDRAGVQANGVSSYDKVYKHPLRFTGPCIMHITAIASTADVEGSSSFNMTIKEID